ncbi:glycosyltransferase [Planococcus beigongshangi]|uniref:glycosyltransferase n=1 Tax=Planococcus beigongshangi TaxID=2782536 RepID=UPI00193C0A0C|nr:glycosyltransferase [Planococcus beigongshangi]
MLKFLYSIKFHLKISAARNSFFRKLLNLLIIFLSLTANVWVKIDFKINKKSSGINLLDVRERKVVVSLTTFPARIDTIWISIESIFRQTYKPDIVILWLAKSQFKDIQSLPHNLKKLQKKGLEIRFCDDLRSHKKYYYAFKEFSKDIIITIDDDVIYPENTIEALIKLHKIYPEYICCNRAHLITTTKGNQIKSYEEWLQNPLEITDPTEMLCPTGVSGVLYPPNSVNEEVFNKESIKKLCFHADDLWLKAMSIINNTKVVKSTEFPSEFFVVSSSQKESLGQINIIQNQNNKQLQAIIKEYNIEFSNRTI